MRVELGLRALDFLHVVVRPLRERAERTAEGAAERRELVLHARLNLRVDGPLHQSVALEVAQRLRQHLLRDAADHAPQLVEAAVLSLGQDADNQRRPLVGDAIEDQARRTLRLVIDVGAGGKGRQFNGFHWVPRLLWSAYLFSAS